MSKIIIEYNPTGISENSKELIKSRITPSMTSTDGTSSHYEINQVADFLFAELGFCKEVLIVNDLIMDGVSFIEF